MKILHLIETLKLGGAEKALYTTVNEINKQKSFESVVCCLFEKGPIASKLEQIKVPVFCIGMNSPYDCFKGIFGLVAIIKENKIDILHTHLFYANIYGRIAGRLSGVKVIVTTLHNPDYTYENNGRFSFKIRKFIDKCTGKMFNRRFIAVSSAVKNDYQKHMGFKNIDVLYNSIDLNELKIDSLLDNKAVRETIGLSTDDFVLLNIGRLHHQKGQIYLIEAMKILVEKDNHFKLLIVGTGPLREKLFDEINKMRLEKNVFLLGEREDIVRLFQISDLFVFPSLYEAFGVVVAEAMAMKKLVAVSDIDSLKEIVGAAGMYIKSKDSKNIANTVLDISANLTSYDATREKSRQRAIDLFDIEKNVVELEKIYSESFQ